MSLYVEGFVWFDWVVDKIIDKHGVQPTEVEECFFNSPYKTRHVQRDKHQLFGRSDNGRYLFVVFAWEGHLARIITARDMTASERRYYGRK